MIHDAHTPLSCKWAFFIWAPMHRWGQSWGGGLPRRLLMSSPPFQGPFFIAGMARSLLLLSLGLAAHWALLSTFLAPGPPGGTQDPSWGGEETPSRSWITTPRTASRYWHGSRKPGLLGPQGSKHHTKGQGLGAAVLWRTRPSAHHWCPALFTPHSILLTV